MRIISGKFGGRRITFPKHFPVRPTTDFAKNGLFNIISHRFELSEMSVLDLFCGAGGISFELASRGCKKIVSVDNNSDCVSFLKTTSVSLGSEEIFPVKSDAIAFLERCSDTFDFIFADPPYEYLRAKQLPEIIFSKTILNQNGYFILEHPSSADFSSNPFFIEKRKYGNVGFSIFGRNKSF